jgi:hypothetical protein
MATDSQPTSSAAQPDQMAFYFTNEMPKLDVELGKFVADLEVVEGPLRHLDAPLSSVVDGALGRLEALAADAPITLHSAGLASPAMVDDFCAEPKTANMAKVVAGAILLTARAKGGNLDSADIGSLFEGINSEKVNFSFPHVGRAVDGKVLVYTTADGDAWPEPYTSLEGVHYTCTWLGGDKNFPVIDNLSAKATQQMSDIGFWVPLSARIPDEDVENLLAVSDLPGVVFSLTCKPCDAKESSVGYFFHKRDGWAGKLLGPMNFMDCAACANAVFEELNPAHKLFRDARPDVCRYLDHRLEKTVYEGELYKVKIHRNIEMLTLSAVPGTNQVTLCPAGGFQCHATLCGPHGEVAKFCLSDEGFTYPIPFNPYAQSPTKEFYWPDHILKDRTLPTMFYAWAHVGEQTTRSLIHKNLHPQQYHMYKILNASTMVLSEDVTRRRRGSPFTSPQAPVPNSAEQPAGATPTELLKDLLSA